MTGRRPKPEISFLVSNILIYCKYIYNIEALMTFISSLRISANAATVFAAYENIEAWSEWDSDVANVELKDGLVLGSKGWLKPRSGPKASIEIIEVTPSKSFSVQSKLPLCMMCVGHKLEPQEEQTIATHWVEFNGPLSFIFRFIIGRQVVNGFPQALAGLAEYVEK